MNRDHLERLLREPDNLFGPPSGHGYDYVRAALTVIALALGALSGWCLLALGATPAPHPVLASVFRLLAAPFCVGVWFLWPFQLLAGWVGAVVVWFATLHAAACLTGLRRPRRAALACSAVVALSGWGAGFCLGLHF